jgi:type III pantothenate kinase
VDGPFRLAKKSSVNANQSELAKEGESHKLKAGNSKMLLALDVGNTNTTLGLYRLEGEPAPGSVPDASRPDLAAHWRITTHRTQTVDEYGVLFVNLFEMHGLKPNQVTHIIISSVVPPVDSTLSRVCEAYFQVEPVFDCIAAYERYGGPCIVVDFGTATKFEVISARGEYLGGAIAPGLGLSADALFARAAKLSRVDIRRPAKVIGTNTVAHLQSGLYYGFIGLVDGVLERIFAELGPEQKPRAVIATGGLAGMVGEDSRYITKIDDLLTLDGLRILFERNRVARPRVRAH